jgi:hypothetical protein
LPELPGLSTGGRFAPYVPQSSPPETIFKTYDRHRYLLLPFSHWEGIPKGRQQMDSKCKQCGDDNDLFTAFTKYQICLKCTKQNYKKAVKK